MRKGMSVYHASTTNITEGICVSCFNSQISSHTYMGGGIHISCFNHHNVLARLRLALYMQLAHFKKSNIFLKSQCFSRRITCKCLYKWQLPLVPFKKKTKKTAFFIRDFFFFFFKVLCYNGLFHFTLKCRMHAIYRLSYKFKHIKLDTLITVNTYAFFYF